MRIVRYVYRRGEGERKVTWSKVGIIAGGGNLPLKLAEACQALDQPFHILRLTGYAETHLDRFPGDRCGLAEIGKALSLLRAASCDAVVMAGNVRRPNFAALKPDWRGASLLPKVVKAARRGDGALLDVLVQTFNDEGFSVLGADDLVAELVAPAGSLGAHGPTAQDLQDIEKAQNIIASLGPFDVGQGAVVRNGFVLAIEAAEGTDAMLRRCADLPADQKGFEPGAEGSRIGVLVKCPKPDQELRVDLPTIGVQTIELAASAGLRGVAVAAGAALILEKPAVIQAADTNNMFVFGLSASDEG